MLRTISTLLGLASFVTMTNAANPDIISDCGYDCPTEMDACDLDPYCTNFLTHFSASNVSTSFATADSFSKAATKYCNSTFNGTSVCAGTATSTLISCLDTSSCWLETTTYSPDCDYYASVVANFTAWSYTQTIRSLCQASWDEYFDNLFGNDYVTVSVSTVATQCLNSRRALLQESEGGESEGESESSESSESESGETQVSISLQITVYFYSEYSYSVFYDYLVSQTLISSFTAEKYLPSTFLYMSCLTTTCCGSGGDCTTAYDDTACNATAPPTTTTNYNTAVLSGAMSAKPFIAFNLMTITIAMICKLMF